MSFRAVLSDYFVRRNRCWILSLFLAVCLVYLPFLGNPFVFDDLNFFSRAMQDIYAHSIFRFDLRWFPYATLGRIAAVFSDVFPHFFHLGNALLHAANVIVLFHLLRLLSGVAMLGYGHQKTPVLGAWLGALIFAVHPVAVYAVGYVIQISILMATFFALLMQVAYVRGLLSGQKRWLALAVLAYFLACFSKEHSVLMPAGVLALTVLLRDKNQAERMALWVTWGAFAAIGLLVVLRTMGLFGMPIEPLAAALFEQQGIVESTPVLHGLSVLTQAGLFFKYLLLWVVPNPAWMSVDMREPFVSSFAAWQGWLGAAGFVLYGFMAFRLLLRGGKAGLAGFALLYPWLQFMLEFSTIRIQEPFVLYRSYLWMPGMMLFFPLLLAKLPERRTLFGLGLVALLMVPLAWNRLWVFADNYRLWNDAAQLLHSEQQPGADRIYYNRAQAEAAMQKWDDAIADFKRVVAISPKLAPVHNALGGAYLNAGRYQEALAEFDTAIVLKPDNAAYYYGKAVTLKRLHQDDLAMRQMEKSCEMKYTMACLIVSFMHSKKSK